MHAQQYINELAERISVPPSELAQIDRALVSADLRQKARGRSYPELTLREAIRIPLAYMAARGATRAATDLQAIEKFVPAVTLIEGQTRRGEYRSGLKSIGIDVDAIDFKSMTLIEALEHIAKSKAAPWRSAIWGPMFWLQVHLSGPVILQINGGDFEGQIQFTGAMDYLGETHMLTKSVTLNGKVLSWIGHVIQAEG